MSDIAVRAEDISKLYRLGQIGTGTLSHDLNRWWAKVRGKEDPFSKVGEINDRTVKGDSEFVWALQDINFQVNKGEAVGIIGRNGAGKSTLLKLLSKVTRPTTGAIYVDGRIASLLEVGTGFHPEMTGRENIYLNGAILGMTKNEIARKFDEIVDFSGVERYIDTPVKRYSSGMYVRLAFAVAAHLESEILIVDEVLAVGDAEFQKKCLGKMGDVSKGEGRTVLFVSHNMNSVKKLCSRGIILKNGTTLIEGKINNIVHFYENDLITKERTLSIFYPVEESYKMQILNARLKSLRSNNIFYTSDTLTFFIDIINRMPVKDAYVTIDIKDVNEDLIYWTADYSTERFKNNLPGTYNLQCICPTGLLASGIYIVTFAIYSPIRGVVFFKNEYKIEFEIVDDKQNFLQTYNINYPGKIAIESKWTATKE